MNQELIRDWCDWLHGLLTPGTESHEAVANLAKARGKRLHEEQAAAAVTEATDRGLEVADPRGLYDELERVFHPGTTASMRRKSGDPACAPKAMVLAAGCILLATVMGMLEYD